MPSSRFRLATTIMGFLFVGASCTSTGETPTATPLASTTAPTSIPASTRSLTPTIAAEPVNDNPPGISVTVVPYSDTTNTRLAQIHAMELAGPCGSGGYSVWYSFAPEVDQVIVADTLGSEYETIIDVWTGSLSSDYLNPGFENLTPLACSAASEVVFAAVAGVNYVIRITSTLESIGGHLVFHLAPG